MENYIGRLLDNRYEILEDHRRQAGWQLYIKALDHRLNRDVAVKILKKEFSRNPDIRSRSPLESQRRCHADAPEYRQRLRRARAGDVDYIVMELIEGITLKQYLEKQGRLNLAETLYFAVQIAQALVHAHSARHYPSRHQAAERYHPEGRQHQGRRFRHCPYRFGAGAR